MTGKGRVILITGAGLLFWGGVVAYVVLFPASEERPVPRSHSAGATPASPVPLPPPADIEMEGAPQVTRAAPVAPDAGTYGVAGVVRDCATQVPLPGARVDLTVARELGLNTVRATADAAGKFQVAASGATSKAAVLDVDAPGYVTGHWRVSDGERGKTYCLYATSPE